MDAAVGLRPAIGLLFAGRSDRRVLAAFLSELGHEVLAPDPAGGADLSALERAAMIVSDEPAARRHGDALLAIKARSNPVVLPVLVAAPPGTDGAAYLRRGFDELLRTPIAKSDLLARIETYLRLRRQSEEALRASEAFSRSTLDAMAAHTCVVDSAGRITLANRAWHGFAAANGGVRGATCEGASYLDACRSAAADPDAEVRNAARALLDVLEGRRTDCAVEYPCHAPSVRRWFIACAVRFSNAGARHTVVSHTDITGRKESELAAREAEARFRSLTEMSSDFFWETDREHRLTRRSVRAAEAIPLLAGIEVQPGMRPWEIPGLAPGGGSWQAYQSMLDARQAFRDADVSLACANALPRFLSVSGEPVYGDDGAFAGYRGVGRDVTRRRREVRLLAMEHAVATQLAEADEVTAGLTAVLRTICEAKGWDLGRYYRLDEADGVLRAAESWCIDDPAIDRYRTLTRDATLAPGESLAGRVLRTGEPAWEPDITIPGIAVRRELLLAAGLRGACNVPVRSEGRVIGVLAFIGRTLRQPDERLLGAMTSVAGQVGQFLQRKRTEAVLRDSEARQKRIADFGQFALKRRPPEQLIAEAIAVLAERVEVAALFEHRDDGVTLRAAHGEGTAGSVGKSAGWQSGGIALRVLGTGITARLAEEDFRAMPEDRPWSAWLRSLRGGAYVAVTDNGHAHGVLLVGSLRAGGVGEQDLHFAESIAHVLSTALQREQAESRLSFLAQFDALTGLPNRSLLEDRLRQAAAQSSRNGRQTAVLFVDLDRFKPINDTLGHQAGDHVLRETGKRMSGCVRAGDTIARISGDEFVVVLADLAHPDDAGTVAQKILEAVARPFDFDGVEAFVTASIGISIHPGDGADTEQVMRNADVAMYKAKQTARNCYRFFTARMNERAVAKMQMNAELRRAAERREFVLHYQPKMDLRSGALTGVEALLRWNHPQRGLVPPAEFVPALEGSGLILPVGEWVLEEACAQVRRWHQAGLKPVPIAVNLSVKQFRRPDLDALIQRVIGAAGIPPGMIELEITESGIADDPEDAVRQMKNLREAGLSISIDDFGTGYSSLAYLSHMPLSALKIDRSFTRRMLEDPTTMTLVQTMISLAHSLRLNVIAEGVETEPQARMLRLLRCDQMQGYLVGPPLPADELAGRLGQAGPPRVEGMP